MKLTQLLDGSFFSEFILINDNKDAKGGLLLNEFIKQNVKLQNNTHLLCLERNPVICKNTTNAPNFKHYCFNDSRDWLSNKAGLEGQTSKECTNPLKVLQEIQKKSKSETRNVIIIDSLSMFLLLYPDLCYKTIHNLVHQQGSQGMQQQQVICLLHSDVLPGGKRTLTMFEQLAVTNLIVSQDNNKSQVTINHRKGSGRVIQIVEQFYIDKSMRLITKEVKRTKENTVDSSDISIARINNDVTFKLGLEDEEKRARSELVLPYLKTRNQGSGEISYEPDANDDWDEEDPDDDLNI